MTRTAGNSAINATSMLRLLRARMTTARWARFTINALFHA